MTTRETIAVDGDPSGDGNSHSAAPGSLLADSASPSSRPSLPSSPLPFVALAEQTFTPLSMDASDFLDAPEHKRMNGTTSPAMSEGRRLLSTSRSMEQMRRTGNLSRTSSRSTGPAASAAAGPTIVSAMVESFEALHATSSVGYELVRTKSAGQSPAGLMSPPSTLSPSPAGSSPPSPALPAAGNNTASPSGLDAALVADGLGAADNQKPPPPVAAQDANNTPTVPQTAAANSNPDPLASISNATVAVVQAHDAHAPSLPSSSAPIPSTSTVVAETNLIRPTPTANQPQRSRALSSLSGTSVVRNSSSASLSLSHPAPDPNRLSQAGNFLGNIAALEASAERLSMTSSIEDAIREEHNELKRSESRRSSILRARAASTSDAGSVYGQPQLFIASRHNSILGTNNAARSGGYSPGGFIMSPHHSMSGTSGRLRSGSKASSIGMPSHLPGTSEIATAPADLEHTQEFRFLPRHGPGKASTRSVASRLSLAQIAELEPPTSLTKDALDAADRAAAAGEDDDAEEDKIRNKAHQFIEDEFANEANNPLTDYDFAGGEPAPRLQLHQADQYQHYGAPRPGDDRPTTSGSGMTYEQAQAAFGDFDGVHCDPDTGDLIFGPGPDRKEPAPRPRAGTAPRPTTYIDPATGQQMLYYPAPVPAMLNLPPKLSKKPKASPRETRRSQVVSGAPKSARESRFLLPDPTRGLRRSDENAPFMGDLLGEHTNDTDLTPQPSGTAPPALDYLAHDRHPSEASTVHPPAEQREIRRPQRLADADNRKSRPANTDGLPPQLRASAFFDLPSQPVNVEVKDGSAMSTLDHLLDASAAAPVSAFTDHVFAGKLGAEVYGPTKKKKKVKKSPATPTPPAVPDAKVKRKTLVKRNSSSNILDGLDDKPKRKTLVKRNSSGNLLDPSVEKKRATRFSLFGPKPVEQAPEQEDEARDNRHSLDNDSQSERSLSPNPLAPEEGDSTDTESEEEEDEDEPVYQGPPTTLLAELQLRKQQNLQRTRPTVRPDGMRSTLLELDAVAEVERKARHGKRVTLAWEDPAAVPRDEDEDDDEVPLGMLFAAKAAGPAGGNRATMDISTLMSEMHRPLGLMERREIEENEPLSRRRERLQGRVNEQLPTSLSALQKRMSHMPGTPGMQMRSQSRLTLPHTQGGASRSGSLLGSDAGNLAEGDDPEVEGETLAARKARLASENPLPRARPVSSSFSAELLREFGPDEEEAAKKPLANVAHNRTTSRDTTTGPPDNGDAVPEEEETLGQRRRRLQREREAREREMAFSALNGTAAPPAGGNAEPAALAIRPGPVGMAGLLGSRSAGQMVADPREIERLRRETELARHHHENNIKMAALRAQMPTNLTSPAVGARAGGYMNGRFNDGGGGTGAPSGLAYGGAGTLLGMQAQQQQAQRASTVLGAQGMMGGVYGGSTPNLGMYPNGMAGIGGMVPPGSAGGYGMPMVGAGGAGVGVAGQGHMDMVERWRQGVMP
ncbi:uncharacterized protein C8A04DRAFT_30698 [Dichotomopilus funicola]|uniref:Uncharacterized protein n=1 Tax=Dichotomopilus funicola TaxID=1934379 RepID=A0AAN6UZG0_9PEZI|nr:hypothetical protein C8A04DRAFT_30698 [Dichotomopilus funicola]